MLLKAYPGIFAFLPRCKFFSNGRKLFSQLERNFFLTGEIFGSNCGYGEELADEEDLRRGDFFRIKDNIIVSKSVFNCGKNTIFAAVFANKVKNKMPNGYADP